MMESANKQTALEAEIYAQPAVFRCLLEQQAAHVGAIARRVRGQFDYLFVAARGTSDNAARYAQYLFGARNRVPVALATPSLFSIYHQPPDLSGAFVLGISQSGQSPDIVSVLAEGRRQGRPTMAITNAPASPLAEAAEFVIDICAGPELSVAATKTYTNSLGALALFSEALSEGEGVSEALYAVPEQMQYTLQALAPILDRVERYRYMQHCAVIGRGYNYSTAFEIALKIKELTRVVAEPYSSADFRHGPIVMAQDGFPVIFIAPTGAVFEDLSVLLKELRQNHCELLMISDDASLLEQSHLAMTLPSSIAEHLTPLTAVLPGQMFSLLLAKAKGLDPDHPYGLSKVTLTR